MVGNLWGSGDSLAVYLIIIRQDLAGFNAWACRILSSLSQQPGRFIIDKDIIHYMAQISRKEASDRVNKNVVMKMAGMITAILGVPNALLLLVRYRSPYGTDYDILATAIGFLIAAFLISFIAILGIITYYNYLESRA